MVPPCSLCPCKYPGPQKLGFSIVTSDGATSPAQLCPAHLHPVTICPPTNTPQMFGKDLCTKGEVPPSRFDLQRKNTFPQTDPGLIKTTQYNNDNLNSEKL